MYRKTRRFHSAHNSNGPSPSQNVQKSFTHRETHRNGVSPAKHWETFSMIRACACGSGRGRQSEGSCRTCVRSCWQSVFLLSTTPKLGVRMSDCFGSAKTYTNCMRYAHHSTMHRSKCAREVHVEGFMWEGRCRHFENPNRRAGYHSPALPPLRHVSQSLSKFFK